MLIDHYVNKPLYKTSDSTLILTKFNTVVTKLFKNVWNYKILNYL